MGAPAADAAGDFVAVPQDAAACPLQDPYVKSLLLKWGLHGRLQLHAFRYTKFYHRLQLQDELVHDLLNSPELQQRLQLATRSAGTTQLQGHVTCIKARQVPATETRLDLFDRLLAAEPPVVQRSGDLVKCVVDQREGFQVVDELRRLLLCEESEHFELFGEPEKQQLLWRLFELLALGGACCQFEDQLQPYLEVVKRLYRGLLSVRLAEGATGAVEVTSAVAEVTDCSCESGAALFPVAGARTNLLLVAADPQRRLVRVLYYAHLPLW